MVKHRQYPGFLDSELLDEERRDPLFHVLPVPMEKSVSYGKGTAAGPAAILEASQQLERWDGLGEPISRGITTLEPIDCSGSAEMILGQIETVCRPLIEKRKMVVLLGGEHTVSLGAIRAIAGYRQDVESTTPFGIIQIDAHADLRENYENNPLSHACVMRRAVEECGCPLFQFGVRALSREEDEYRRKKGIHYLDGRQLYGMDLESFRLPEDFPEEVYLSIDVDGLDPAVIPATGTPVPGGPDYNQTLWFIERVLDGRRLLGYDCVELAPRPTEQRSDFVAAMLVYAVMGCVDRQLSERNETCD